MHNYLDASSSAFSLLVLATCRTCTGHRCLRAAPRSCRYLVPGRSVQVRYLSCNPGLATGTAGSCRFLSPSPTYTYLKLLLLLFYSLLLLLLLLYMYILYTLKYYTTIYYYCIISLYYYILYYTLILTYFCNILQ